MTIIDKTIPFYVWFATAFGLISMVIGIANFAMLFVTLITVKGYDIPAIAIPAITIVLLGGCIALGFVMERYNFQNRVYRHVNTNQNPQMKQISEDVSEIKRIINDRGLI
jgi:uncharacterized membrane protein YidH (DUF202 family)